MKFYSIPVKQIGPETHDTLSLYLEIPVQLKEIFTYTQGQHLTLRFWINGQEERRSYSFSSSPVEETVCITVKRVRNGLVSNWIHDHISPRDKLEVTAPMGQFHTPLAPDLPKSYFMIAGGSGITPLFSILKSVLGTEPESRVFLLYGNRDHRSIIFHQDLIDLANQYEGRLRIRWITGPMDNQILHHFFNFYRPLHIRKEYFICGPGPVMELSRDLLLEKGISREHIHLEYFGAPKQALPVPTTVMGAALTAHMPQATIRTSVTPGKTLLETLIEEGHDPPYSCKSGACSTCLARCLRGTVEMGTNLTLEADELASGLILTCQSRPRTEEIEITFNIHEHE